MNNLFSLLLFLVSINYINAQINAKMIQYPDVSKTHICFTYGDDIWIVAKEGGEAKRIISPKGREVFAKFSPNGKSIVFNANYDGNNDIYTMPITGGIPTRLTAHGMSDNILDWYPDGKNILYASSRESGKQRFAQFYKVSVKGGMSEKLPIMVGAFAAISPDKRQLAFNEKSRVFRNWKRYRGGTAPDLYLYDFKTGKSENITNNDANDELPMWHGKTLYYMSDRGSSKRNNIWAYDTKKKTHKQITKYKKYDVNFPSIGPNDMVFENGGKLYILDLKNHRSKEVKINVVSDFISLRPHRKNVKRYIQNFDISPDGKRALIEARGEVFTLPKKYGIVKNITQSSASAERYPAWSPDGTSIAYWSDKTGEYNLMIRDLETEEEKQITHFKTGYRYNIYWSPDSKYVVFIDQTMTINLLEISSGNITKIDHPEDLMEGGLRGFGVSWSSDSEWILYSRNVENSNQAIFVYNMKSKKRTQITTGFYSDRSPVFDVNGEFIYFTTNRTFRPEYSRYDNTWIYNNATTIGAIRLQKDSIGRLPLRNDEVKITKEEEEDEDSVEVEGQKGGDQKDDKKEEKAKKDDKEEEDAIIKIDFDEIERRIEILPIKAGNLGSLRSVEGKLIFAKYPNSGSEKRDTELKYFDFKNREEKTIISGYRGYELSFDHKSIIVNQTGKYGIIKVAAAQKIKDVISTDELSTTVTPKEEWKQMFNDVWRIERDFFYDAGMHGVDWNKMKKQYGSLIDKAVTRSDVNFIFGQLIGELNASHTYTGGGDLERSNRTSIGYLGVDWEYNNGHYRIKKIIRPASWETEIKSPLDAPGIGIKEGDYIFEINGISLNEYNNVWEAFEGLNGKTIELTYGSIPDVKEAKKALVKPLRGETRLRNLAWIEANRQRVDKASNGRVGYVYVPSTGRGGQNELVRQYYAQWHKEGLIIDERFNNGGQIPDRFVELLNRKPLAYFSTRYGANWQFPPNANFGKKVMLINGWSGSGGDAFPAYFKEYGIGPLIGTRTWGGLIGISGAPSLIDGGGITVPTFRMYGNDGKWFKEGHGVDPDIEVKEDPSALAKGTDVQLEKAIEEVMKSIGNTNTLHPKRPKYENRSK